VLAAVRPRALRIPGSRLPFFALYAVMAVAGVQALYFLAITRLPAWASVTARLAVVVLLPSPCSELVSWMDFICRSSPMKSTLVRRAR
jgi:hypothetical protein